MTPSPSKSSRLRLAVTLGLVALLGWGPMSALAAQDVAIASKRWDPAKAKAGWAELEAKCRSLQIAGQRTYVRDFTRPGLPEEHSRIVQADYLFKVSGDRAVKRYVASAGIDIPARPEGYERVVGVNERESYSLERESGQAQFVIEALTESPGTRDPAMNGARGPFGEFVRPLYGHCTWLPPLTTMIDTPEFHLKSAEDVDKEGIALVALTFDYEGDPQVPNAAKVRGGRLLLDPACKWAVREATLPLALPRGTGTMLWSYEFRPDPDGFPAVERVTQTRYDRPDAIVREILGVRSWLYRTIPDEEFRPEAFGVTPDRKSKDNR